MTNAQPTPITTPPKGKPKIGGMARKEERSF